MSDIDRYIREGFDVYVRLSLDLIADLERNPPQRLLGINGLTGRPCLSCGSKADFYGRIPCGH